MYRLYTVLPLTLTKPQHRALSVLFSCIYRYACAHGWVIRLVRLAYIGLHICRSTAHVISRQLRPGAATCAASVKPHDSRQGRSQPNRSGWAPDLGGEGTKVGAEGVTPLPRPRKIYLLIQNLYSGALLAQKMDSCWYTVVRRSCSYRRESVHHRLLRRSRSFKVIGVVTNPN